MSNSFLSENELRCIGFKRYGTNVMISRKASIYGAELMEFGDNIRIDDFCILSGRIVIGNYVHIAAMTSLYGSSAGIYISDYVNISSRIGIFATSDDYSGLSMTSPLIPGKYKNVDNRPVHINSHVIIGTNSTVLPGCTLEEGSSFGAMTLINHDSKQWTINAGIPFRELRERNKKILELTKQFEGEFK